MAHLADVISTHWRNQSLTDEGNVLYLALQRYGLSGWPYLISIKIVMVGAFSFAYWWYLCVRAKYLPDRRVNSIRGLVWYGMWDRKPYPHSSLLRRIFNLRKFQFGALVMAAIALPTSAVSALYFSVDNVHTALGHELPFITLRIFVLLTTPTMFGWWCLAYRQFYREQLRLGLIPDAEKEAE